MTTLQVYAHRLSDPNLGKLDTTTSLHHDDANRTFSLSFSIAPQLKVTIANELRDQVEVFQTLEYPRFLATLIPVFVDILQNGNPVFQSNVPEQVRHFLHKRRIVSSQRTNKNTPLFPYIEITKYYIGNYISITTNRNIERIRTRIM